jgi:hypothetical protein
VPLLVGTMNVQARSHTRNTHSINSSYLEDDELVDAVHELWPEVRANLQSPAQRRRAHEVNLASFADIMPSVTVSCKKPWHVRESLHRIQSTGAPSP